MDTVEVTFTEKAPLLVADTTAFTVIGQTPYVVMGTAIVQVSMQAPCLVSVTDKASCLVTGSVKDEVTRKDPPQEADIIRAKRQDPPLKTDTVTVTVTDKASHLVAEQLKMKLPERIIPKRQK